ncbi:MAG TPA: hypothetical protein VMD30_08570 [Tepidisphaeraceae bacterium]|nr:hypothetical protein [Tepidisphaeraceae bacterium]
MESTPGHPGDFLIGPRRRSQRRRLIRFIDNFNSPSAEPVQGQRLEQYAAIVQSAVRAEILHPETANFDWIVVRQCPDGMLRAAGSIHLDGIDGSRAERWYLAEFPDQAAAEVLEIIDRDPVAMKTLTPQQWADTVLRYARPGAYRARRPASIWRWLVWPAIILLAALLISRLFSHR